MLNSFLFFLVKVAFSFFYRQNVFSVHFYILRKKATNNNNWIRALVIYFYCMLIDMINGCTYVY